MVGMDTDHFGIINACLQGHRSKDDRTLSSIIVLQERLERLKQNHSAFTGVSFSHQVDQWAGSTLASTAS